MTTTLPPDGTHGPAGQPATPAELARELTRELPRLKKQFDRMLARAAKALADQNPDQALARVFHGMVAEPDRETVAATAAMAVLALAKQRAAAARATGPAPTTYALPAEPPPEVTELWDRIGGRWEPDPEPEAAGYWFRVDEHGQVAEEIPFGELVFRYGRLSTAPPGTEAGHG